MSSSKYAEPFRIKAVEMLKETTPEYRRQILEDVGYNLFKVKADDIYIDCLTDSGTSAMSDRQWAALMTGDESYVGNRCFYEYEKTIQDLFGFQYVIPTHQGRAAEQLLARMLYPKRPKAQFVRLNSTADQRIDNGYKGADKSAGNQG
jgi:tyrosine phenol-lyase